MHKIHITADCRKHAAEKMRVESRALDVDAQEPCALSVAADRVEVSSESCPSEEDEQKDDYEKCNDDADLYISRNIYSFLIDGTHERDLDPGVLELDEFLILNVELRCVDDGGKSLCEEESSK